MEIPNAWRESCRSFFDLGGIFISALFLSNLALGPLGLKIFMTLLALVLFFVGRFLGVNFILLTIVAGGFSAAFWMIFGDWRLFFADLFWLTVIGDFAVNRSYFLVFFLVLFLSLFILVILKRQKNRAEKYR